MFRIVEDESPPIPEGFSPMLRNFLELCFNKDPDCRPNAAILFEHPWLKQKWGAHKVSGIRLNLGAYTHRGCRSSGLKIVSRSCGG